MTSLVRYRAQAFAIEGRTIDHESLVAQVRKILSQVYGNVSIITRAIGEPRWLDALYQIIRLFENVLLFNDVRYSFRVRYNE